ncbi:sigma-54 interaction domain-containing protein [Peribacillus faecalis]|nr:sigma 54-interacting transcriptional regulator [Peribacillus faecalis]
MENQMLQQFINASFDGIAIFDKDGKGVFINDSCAFMTGIPREEFIGNTLANVLQSGLISDSVALQVINKKKAITKIINIKGKDFLITGSPVTDEHSEVHHVILNVRDIAELNKLKMDEILAIALRYKYADIDIDSTEDRELYEKLYHKGVIAKSPAMKTIVKTIKKVAKVKTTVLITGESGTGKEVLLKLIHELSDRSNKPLIKINCAAIPNQLLESELFGYERGAFTGANQRGKRGLFEEADGGTLFLDEIGDMSLDLQAKLLRVLQEFHITRVGGRTSRKVDVRIVSATNKDFKKMVEQNRFREDLYYRLNIIPIHLPPLRERIEDIGPLAHLFLNKINHMYNLHKKFAPGIMHILESYQWPGNIREMEHMIERLAVTLDSDYISWKDLPFVKGGKNHQKMSLKQILHQVEKEIILEKMKELKTTRKTADALGISQSALVKKMQKFQ